MQRVFEFLSIASSIQYVAYIAGVCKRLVRRLSSINRQAFTRDRFGKCKRIEGKKHNVCTLNACEILIHLVVIFLSEVIFVFLLFLGMVMYAIWSWNKRKTKITSDKKLTTTYIFYEFLNGFLYGFYMTTRCREDKLQIFLLPQHPILNRSNFL